MVFTCSRNSFKLFANPGPERLQCKGCPPLLVVGAIRDYFLPPQAGDVSISVSQMPSVGFQPLLCRPGFPGDQSMALMRQGQMFGLVQGLCPVTS